MNWIPYLLIILSLIILTVVLLSSEIRTKKYLQMNPERNIIYDGPHLDPKFFEYNLFERKGNKIYGTGSAFHVQFPENGSIDGDTCRFFLPNNLRSLLNINPINKEIKTRFFNLDCPETFKGGEQPFGKQAKIFVKQLLQKANSVVIQTDPGERLFDKYGRLLGWIWVQFENQPYKLLNYLMVRNGLGKVKYLKGAGETKVTFYDGLSYTEWMLLGQLRAIQEKKGIYSNIKY